LESSLEWISVQAEYVADKLGFGAKVCSGVYGFFWVLSKMARYIGYIINLKKYLFPFDILNILLLIIKV